MCFSNVTCLEIYSEFPKESVFFFADYSQRKTITTDTTIHHKRRETTAYFMVCYSKYLAVHFDVTGTSVGVSVTAVRSPSELFTPYTYVLMNNDINVCLYSII